MKINPQTILVRDIPPLLEGFVFVETTPDETLFSTGDPVTVDTLLKLIDARRDCVTVLPAL